MDALVRQEGASSAASPAASPGRAATGGDADFLLPQRCARHIVTAELHRRLAMEGERKAREINDEALKLQSLQSEVRRVSYRHETEMETRTAACKYALKKFQDTRRAAEEEHSEAVRLRDAECDAELAALDQKVKEVRETSQAKVLELRRSSAAARASGEREMAELQAEFGQRREALSCQLQEHQAKCGAAVEMAESHCRVATFLARGAWHQSDHDMKTSRIAADDEIQRCAHFVQEASTAAEQKFNGNQETFLLELRAIKDREAAIRQDNSAEELARQAQARGADEIREKKAATASYAQKCDELVAQLSAEMAAAAADVLDRSRCAQEEADHEVLAIVAELQRFAEGDHTGHLFKLHGQLQAAALSARESLDRQAQCLQRDVSKSAHAATCAAVVADVNVARMREKQILHNEMHDHHAAQDLAALSAERAAVVQTGEKQLFSAQGQMVRHITSQQDAMLARLDCPEPDGLVLRLNLASALP